MLNSNLFGVITKLYNEADDRDKSLVKMLVLSLFFSPVVAGASVGYCIYFFFEGKVLGIIIGIFVTILLFLHHKSLLHNFQRGVIYFVFFLSLIIAGFLTMPLKFSQNQEFWTNELINMNQERYDLGQIEGERRVELLIQRKEELESIRQKAANIFHTNKQPLADARRNLVSFNKEYEKRKNVALKTALLETGYEADLDTSKITVFKFFINQNFSGNGEGDSFLFWIYFFLFLIIEGSPGAIALMLYKSDYMDGVLHIKEIKRKFVQKRNDAEIEIVENLEDAIRRIVKRNIVQSSLDSFMNDFSDTKRVLRQFQLLRDLDMGVNARFGSATTKAKRPATPPPQENSEELEEELNEADFSNDIPGHDYENL